MKKPRKQKQFLEELKRTPIVSAVCNKIGISRQTVYRWINDDPEFRLLYEKALSYGTANMNDLGESKMIGAMNNGEPWAIKYWLESNCKKYLRPRLPANNIRKLEENNVTDIDVEIHYTKYNDPNSMYYIPNTSLGSEDSQV